MAERYMTPTRQPVNSGQGAWMTPPIFDVKVVSIFACLAFANMYQLLRGPSFVWGRSSEIRPQGVTTACCRLVRGKSRVATSLRGSRRRSRLQPVFL